MMDNWTPKTGKIIDTWIPKTGKTISSLPQPTQPTTTPKEDYAMLAGKGLANIIPGLAYAAQYYQQGGNVAKAQENIRPFEALQGQGLGGKLAEAAPTALGRLPFYIAGAGGMGAALGKPIVGGALGFGGMGGLEQVLQGQPRQAPRAALQSAISYPVLHGIGKGAGVLPTELTRRAGTGLGFGGYSALTSLPEDRLTQTILGTGLGAAFKPKPQREYLAEKVSALKKISSDTYREVLGVKPQELKNIEIRKGGDIDNAFKVMADEGLPLDKTVEGNVEAGPAREILKTRITTMSNELNNFLKQDLSTKFDLDAIANKAKKVVEERTSNAKEAEGAKIDIDEFIKAEKIRYGKVINDVLIPAESVNALTLNKIKQGMWSVGYDQLKPTNQSNARKIGRIIEETIDKTYPNSPIKRLNDKMGDYLTALGILETPRRSPSGGIGAIASRVLGSILGSRVPVAGTIGGWYLGGKAFETIKSPKRRITSAAKKASQAQKIEMLNPQIKQFLQQILSGKYASAGRGF